MSKTKKRTLKKNSSKKVVGKKGFSDKKFLISLSVVVVLVLIVLGVILFSPKVALSPSDDVCGTFHDADSDEDGKVDTGELQRLIQFFNSGSYHCGIGTEDGFAPGSGDESCDSHDADTNEDWSIDLYELLRVTQFFNSGGYHYCPAEGTEDDFCVGSAEAGECPGALGQGDSCLEDDDCLTGFICHENICLPETGLFCYKQEGLDSLERNNIYYRITPSDTIRGKFDQCYNEMIPNYQFNELAEYKCNGDSLASEVIDCDNGCYEGRCVGTQGEFETCSKDGDCGTNLECFEGLCVPDSGEFCYDTDEDESTEKGNTYFRKANGEPGLSYDVCLTNDKLIELTCEGDVREAEVVDCSSGCVLGVCTSTPPSELEGSILAYYSFDDLTNALPSGDASCEGDGCPTNIDGKIGKAYRFDGVDDVLKISSPSFKDLTTKEEFSVAMWFKVTGGPNTQILLSQEDGTGQGREWLFAKKAGCLDRGVGSSLNGVSTCAGVSPTTGTWHHLVLVYSQGKLSFYFDRTKTSLGDVSLTLEEANGGFVIGAHRDGKSYPITGEVDELVIFNKALTTSEVFDEYSRNTEYDIQITGVCGDGVCNNGETCSSCSADCGSCSNDNPSTTGQGGDPDEDPEDTPGGGCVAGQELTKTCDDGTVIITHQCFEHVFIATGAQCPGAGACTNNETRICDDGSTIVVKECVDGELILTTNSCTPVEESKTNYWIVGIVLGLVILAIIGVIVYVVFFNKSSDSKPELKKINNNYSGTQNLRNQSFKN